MGASIVISVLADTKKASSGLAGLAGETSSFGDKFKKLAVGIGALGVAGGVAAGAVVGKAVSAASDLQQAMGGVEAVFTSNSKQVESWANSANQAVGLTSTEYGNLATLIGSQLKNGGTALDQLGSKTNSLISTGADLSAMFGGTTKDAVDALSSALKGERDPIERYGVSLNQSKIDAEAAALGFTKVGGSLSAEANQAATLSLIMKQTTAAHGAFARESDTLAGQQQRLGATFNNVIAQLGPAFLPAATAATAAVGKLLNGFANSSAFNGFITDLGKFITDLFNGNSAIGGFASQALTITSSLSPVLAIVRYLAANAATVGPVFAALGSAIGSTLVAILPTVVDLAKSFGTVLAQLVAAAMPVVISLVGNLAAILAQLLPSIIDVVTTLGDGLATVLTGLAPVISQVIAALGPALTAILQALTPILLMVVNTFTQLLPVLMPLITQAILPLVSAVLQLLVPLLQLVGPILTPLIQLFGVLLTPVLGLVKVIVSLLVPVLTVLIKIVTGVILILAGGLTVAIKAISALFSGGFSAVISRLGALWSSVWAGIRAVFNLHVAAIRLAVSTLVGFFSGVWSTITSGISGFGSAVASGISGVIETVTGIPGRIRTALAGLAKIGLDAGKSIVDGLISGIRNMIGSAGDAISSVMDKISSFLPHSPAKTGPFSGRGWTLYSGQAIGDALATGMLGTVGTVRGAASKLVGAASFDAGATFDASATAARGTVVHQVALSVPMLTPGPEAGRVITAALDDYYRVNGRRLT